MGVDVKSHQDGLQVPCAAVVQGNEAQDDFCDEARRQRQPLDVHIPSCGFYAFFSIEGFAVTSPLATAIKKVLREQASAQ